MRTNKRKSNKMIAEQLVRSSTKKQQEKLYREVKKAGGDIGMRVRKDEKTKEDKLPNVVYMDNPFGSNRFIETYEDFLKANESAGSLARPNNTNRRGSRLHEEAGLPRKDTVKKIKKFAKKAKKGGKDIGDKTKDKYTKDPLAANAEISTYESMHQKQLKHLYYWRDRDKISLNNDSWVRGTADDFDRPMFKNLPDNIDRYPYDVLRSGKFIETKDGKLVGQIDRLKDNQVIIDVINDNNEHEYVAYDLNKLVKKIKDKTLKVTANSTYKEERIKIPKSKFKIKVNQ